MLIFDLIDNHERAKDIEKTAVFSTDELNFGYYKFVEVER